MELPQAINKVIQHQHLNEEEMQGVMQTIMTGGATPAQIGGFLIGLRMKGETVEEITAAAKVTRALATKVSVDSQYLVDTCGTGGDSAKTFNISTASALVAAAAGVKVAKHGNRSVSSKSGSADVLEAAGVELMLTPQQVAQCVNEIGVGFMFAPAHHGAMKHAIGPRREMGVRTIFNILGPLTNPANSPNQVLGVFDKNLVTSLAHVLANLGSRHVLVVHADDGLDEISVSSNTTVAELKDGKITTYEVKPQDFGLSMAHLDTLRVTDVQQSLKVIQDVLAGIEGPASDVVALNSGAAIYVAGKADSLISGIEAAKEAIRSGEAKRKFDALVRLTGQFKLS